VVAGMAGPRYLKPKEAVRLESEHPTNQR